MLEIIYQDDWLVAVNKPNGLLVHRTKIASREDIFALQTLRNQINQHVFPIHRLDRKTSGVLLFALDAKTVKNIQKQIENQSVTKRYLAIVRGWFPEKIEVNHDLTNDRNKTQEAITFFQKINRSEIPVPLGKFETSRYSLIEAFPKTGRQHQIRKHLNHLRHPIIGDRPHGCSKQNRLFKAKWEMTTMLLHAAEFHFTHPVSGKPVSLFAKANEEFSRMQKTLEL